MTEFLSAVGSLAGVFLVIGVLTVLMFRLMTRLNAFLERIGF
jgi:hypothetical protein